MLLELAHHVLPVGPAIAADDEKSIREIELLDRREQLPHRHALAEAHDNVRVVVLAEVRHELLELNVLVVAQNLRGGRSGRKQNM